MTNPDNESRAAIAALEDFERLRAFVEETWGTELGPQIITKLKDAGFFIMTDEDVQVMVRSLRACSELVELHSRTPVQLGDKTVDICEICTESWPCSTIEILYANAPGKL